MCVDQLVQKYIDALPSQYRSDVPIPSSNNVEYWPVQFWLWDKRVIEIDTIDGSFGAWEHIGQAIEAAIVKLIDHVRDVEMIRILFLHTLVGKRLNVLKIMKTIRVCLVR